MLKANERTDKGKNKRSLGHYGHGIDAPWYEPRKLSETKREALLGSDSLLVRPVNIPRLNPDLLMPQVERTGFRALSLFSGGGGLDIGFVRAGFEHVASY